MIGFWKRLVCGKQSKIYVMLYKLMYQMHTRNFCNSKRLSYIDNILKTSGYSEYWINQNVPENSCLSKMIKKKKKKKKKQIN